jgi:hypothetical protein
VARGAMEGFGNGRRLYSTGSTDSFRLLYILGKSTFCCTFIHNHLINDCRYSMDFFDESHQVVVRKIFTPGLSLFSPFVEQIGGSYATIPRIAERNSVRNWYQRSYPYAWVGARLAYDVSI